MKLFSENIEDLRTLYVANLKKALDMEQKITKALPTMIEKSTDPQLASAFRNHLTETQGHLAKVESILRDATNGNADTSTCKAISALITEAEDSIKDAGDESIRDIKSMETVVNDCFKSKDYIEGRDAFMEKRKPVFTGA